MKRVKLVDDAHGQRRRVRMAGYTPNSLMKTTTAIFCNPLSMLTDKMIATRKRRSDMQIANMNALVALPHEEIDGVVTGI